MKVGFVCRMCLKRSEEEYDLSDETVEIKIMANGWHMIDTSPYPRNSPWVGYGELPAYCEECWEKIRERALELLDEKGLALCIRCDHNHRIGSKPFRECFNGEDGYRYSGRRWNLLPNGWIPLYSDEIREWKYENRGLFRPVELRILDDEVESWGLWWPDQKKDGCRYTAFSPRIWMGELHGLEPWEAYSREYLRHAVRELTGDLSASFGLGKVMGWDDDDEWDFAKRSMRRRELKNSNGQEELDHFLEGGDSG